MHKRKAAIALAVLLGCVILANAVLAQGGHDLSWWTVDGGGGISSGGGYTLSARLGSQTQELLLVAATPCSAGSGAAC